MVHSNVSLPSAFLFGRPSFWSHAEHPAQSQATSIWSVPLWAHTCPFGESLQVVGTNVTGLVGGADGASDCVSDGARLGSDDGARLGTKDGCSVASILGAIVGDGVLPAVGTSVGA